MKRAFIRKEPIYQRTNKKGNVFAYKLIGENTNVIFIERLQGKFRKEFYNILFTIEFTDTKQSNTTRSSELFRDESLYVQYALDLLEQDSLEEYYKTALLITKNRLIKSIDSFKKSQIIKNTTGYWPYPICTNPTMYKRWFLNDEKLLKTIDVTKDDLVYFNSYESC